MTRPLFLCPLDVPLPATDSLVELTGEEGRHAAVVRRIHTGEEVILSDGTGRGVIGEVTAADKAGLVVRVIEQLTQPEQRLRVIAVQALAKGDRSELAVEMLTEVGVDEIIPWQASRSIVKWSGDRGEKSLNKWRATVREAAKQSRRLIIPEVSAALTTKQLLRRIESVDLAVVLHEDASQSLAAQQLPASGSVLLVVGPEGGISAEELELFTAAGARPVQISDGVLRTSTAGVVAVGRLRM